MPPMPVPGHAAYPSNHAGQSHLIAYFLEFILPGRHPARQYLHPLADRIALNREVMGLHYRSDSDAGAQLALWTAQAAETVINEGKTIFAQAVEAAAKEWERKRAPYGTATGFRTVGLNPQTPGTGESP